MGAIETALQVGLYKATTRKSWRTGRSKYLGLLISGSQPNREATCSEIWQALYRFMIIGNLGVPGRFDCRSCLRHLLLGGHVHHQQV
jgi:hypothetical protein